MNTKDFLELFFEENEVVHFRAISKDGAKKIDGKYFDVINQLKKLNKNGYNIYYVVNSGGHNKQDIHRINALFVDFDAGRNEDNQYHTIEYLKQYKKEIVEKVKSFPLKTTAIVETRNGIHAYWKVSDCVVEDFEKFQKRLIQFFDSDERVFDISRVMRLPNYNWVKDRSQPFMCRVIQHDKIEYTIEEFNKLLPQLKLNNHKNTKINNATHVKDVSINMNEHQSINIELIKKRDWKSLRDIINNKNKYSRIEVPIDISSKELYLPMGTCNQTVIFHYNNDVYNHLYQQDLGLFLGIDEKSFSCIIHNDNSKSASIFQTHDGNYIYKCFSSNCRFGSGNINKVTEALTGLNRPDTLEFLMNVYGIEIVKTDWQKEQERIIESNLDLLLNSSYLKDHYPDLFKRINKYIPQLIILHEYAKRNIFMEEIFSNQKNVIFKAPIRSLSEEFMKMDMNSDPKAIAQRNNIMVFIGMLIKLIDDEIPQEKLLEAKEYAERMGYTNFANFYSLPSYDYNVLNNATEKSLQFTENNMTVKGFSRELLVRTFGEDEANRVYPRQKGKEVYEGNDRIIFTMKKATLDLMSEKGWISEKEIVTSEYVDNLIREEMELKEKQNVFKRRKERLWKVCIQEFLDEYGLERQKLNKQLISRFKIKGIKGYPYIIFKK